MVHSKYILNSDISDAALRALLHSTDHGSADSTDNTDTRYPATWYSSEEGTSDKDSSDQVWVVAHGSLMAASVILMVPVGILVARHQWLIQRNGVTPPFLRRMRIVFIAVWMLLATAVMLAGFIIPFQTFMPWSHVSGEATIVKAHVGIGITVFSLFGFHALFGAIRPRDESLEHTRALHIWTVVHLVSGYATAGLAVANVYNGIYLVTEHWSMPLAPWLAPITSALVLILLAGVLLEHRKTRYMWLTNPSVSIVMDKEEVDKENNAEQGVKGSAEGSSTHTGVVVLAS